MYSVDEYQSLMMNSIRQTKPTVTQMADKMFDIQDLIRQLGLMKKTVDISGRFIAMRDKVRWIKMTQFGSYHYKHSFSPDKPWKQFIKIATSLPFGHQAVASCKFTNHFCEAS